MPTEPTKSVIEAKRGSSCRSATPMVSEAVPGEEHWLAVRIVTTRMGKVLAGQSARPTSVADSSRWQERGTIQAFKEALDSQANRADNPLITPRLHPS